MGAFVLLGLVFSIPSQEIGFGKRLRNDLVCVEWDIIHNSVNRSVQNSGRKYSQTFLSEYHLAG